MTDEVHLLDFTLGLERKAACGSLSENFVLEDKFRTVPPKQRCPACIAQHYAAIKYMKICRICSKNFASESQRNTHELNEHELICVSYRGAIPCFVISVGYCFDRPDAVARTLTAAARNLAVYFPNWRFEIIPHTHEVMSKEPHVTSFVSRYLAIPTPKAI